MTGGGERELKEKIVKGHCPKCGPKINALVAGSYVRRDDEEEGSVWWQGQYRILVCRGCDSAYFETEELFSEDIDHRQDPFTGHYELYYAPKVTYWPSPSKRERPKWSDEIPVIDDPLSDLLNDIYGALDADLRVPAAIAIRTAFDRASELLKVDPAKSFAEKLTDLVSAGKISMDEKHSLETLTDAGSAAAHRGWRPKPKELDTMMSILESFIHRSFVLQRATNELKQKIPAKPKRKSKPNEKAKAKGP